VNFHRFLVISSGGRVAWKTYRGHEFSLSAALFGSLALNATHASAGVGATTNERRLLNQRFIFI